MNLYELALHRAMEGESGGEGGGGGRLILNPFITVTWYCNEGELFNYNPSNMCLIDNRLVWSELDDGVTPTPQTRTMLTDFNEVTYGCEIAYSSTSSVTFEVTDKVNCETVLDGSTLSALISDISQDASVTVKFVTVV